jgi:hypothetical protein
LLLRLESRLGMLALGVVNPRPVTEPDLLLLLRNAYAGTRP